MDGGAYGITKPRRHVPGDFQFLCIDTFEAVCPAHEFDVVAAQLNAPDRNKVIKNTTIPSVGFVAVDEAAEAFAVGAADWQFSRLAIGMKVGISDPGREDAGGAVTAVSANGGLRVVDLEQVSNFAALDTGFQ